MTQVITVREDTGRKRVQTLNELPSMTVQSDRVSSEIRSILAKYEATGVLEHLQSVDLQFRDVSEFEDFTDIMQQAKTAEQAFMQLEPQIRSVFGNDVAAWLDAAHDGLTADQRRKFEELGVLEKAAEGAAIAEPPPEPVEGSEGGGGT